MALARFKVEMFVLPLLAAMLLANNAKGDECPAGTIKIGEKRTETTDAIIVQPMCKHVAVIPTTCPPGSSVVGSGCMRDTSMRPELSKQQKLVALRLQARHELDEIRVHGFLVSWEGIWTILSRTQVPEASSTAEDESNEMREHTKIYLELQEQIEELTGDKAAAKRTLPESRNRASKLPCVRLVRLQGNRDLTLRSGLRRRSLLPSLPRWTALAGRPIGQPCLPPRTRHRGGDCRLRPKQLRA
jgi:hypothetical protein